MAEQMLPNETVGARNESFGCISGHREPGI
jgi:hypothetical protein